MRNGVNRMVLGPSPNDTGKIEHLTRKNIEDVFAVLIDVFGKAAELQPYCGKKYIAESDRHLYENPDLLLSGYREQYKDYQEKVLALRTIFFAHNYDVRKIMDTALTPHKRPNGGTGYSFRPWNFPKPIENRDKILNKALEELKFKQLQF